MSEAQDCRHGSKSPIRDGIESGWQSWADGIAQFAALPQKLFCKLSGLATEANANWNDDTLKPYVAHLFEQFAPEQLIWGSDWPVLNLNGSYTVWYNIARRLISHLEKTQQEAIFGGTARSFYCL